MSLLTSWQDFLWGLVALAIPALLLQLETPAGAAQEVFLAILLLMCRQQNPGIKLELDFHGLHVDEALTKLSAAIAGFKTLSMHLTSGLRTLLYL